MSQKMEEILRQQFSSETCESLASIFQRAYTSNADCFDPFIGHDEMVFGLMIHKSAKFFIEELAERNDWIEIIQRHPRFLFRIKGYLMSAYRVGDSLEDDISNLFPKNRTGAWMLAETNRGQMVMEFMRDGRVSCDDSTCTSLILGHVGSVEEGLSKMFLGVPSAFDNRNRITGWSTSVEIWSKDRVGSVESGLPMSPEVPRAPVERTLPPMLTLKQQKKQEEGK
jgi:hypothetical protein